MKVTKNRLFHQPVLLNEAVEFLKVKPGKLYLDATLGGGGHSLRIIKKGGHVFGLDQDPEAIAYVKKHFKNVCPNASYTICQGNFANLEEILKKNKISKVSGILFDLGVSSHQLETDERGFSFQIDESLDMRMDPSLKVKAGDLINGLHEKELIKLFSEMGEEPLSLPIAKAVVLDRKREPIRTTRQLAEIVKKVYWRKYRGRSKIHPATKVFLSLRIAVNDELNNLKKGLKQAARVLESGGRLVVISFHGLEDKIVKNYFKKGETEKCLQILTKKVVVPTLKEREENRRSRSAKLRVAVKI
ncbi:16S rRNA (cytosine(1402)-N(4))-methyltransferase [Candidatus Beckwithbacteria bacterium CG10_big_fil_rev_8_21_14_0_10_34_10]|uniref:Ribosomal RNA small subunit methyltransferase H n=1 Tax=Candidatus Beckwithbacteria bacterium CG10_big_fil_rev_8_21_14_0_10_34_10 TaxID=1974495 RepID=A0A2H0WB89_9BACT|nr:MAG: 16S rRNA (cytosine(1402)-N(4))-methyltransferase [Candidatus Beckwithbacteria bacterium CG10_big_fil_rev_8_21_14_0_10_34_10]